MNEHRDVTSFLVSRLSQTLTNLLTNSLAVPLALDIVSCSLSQVRKCNNSALGQRRLERVESLERILLDMCITTGLGRDNMATKHDQMLKLNLPVKKNG